MPLEEFHGDTFVAFVDISGFKVLMKDAERAYKALDSFYRIGYDSLRSARNQRDPNRVDGLLVSDCGVFFSRFHGENHAPNLHPQEHLSALENLLNIIQLISEKMIQEDLMLTTSIAYGKFDYHERIEFVGMEKNFLLGSAYLDAYLDNGVGRPKLEPSQCRMLIDNRLNDFWERVEHVGGPGHSPFNRSKKIPNNKKHLYFYWMVPDESEIGNFNKKYNDAYNLKYRGMLSVLKQFSNQKQADR